MKITVWGDAGGPDTLSMQRSQWGTVVDAHSYRQLNLELPAGGVEIDLDHEGQRVGELIHAELGPDNRLRCAAVLDDDRLEPVLNERSLYFSPVLEMVGDVADKDVYIAREGQLLGLSLVLDTARVGAQPLRWRAGDVRRSPDTSRWPFTWQTSQPLLCRARDHSRYETRARRIVDLRDDAGSDNNPWRLRAGDRVPPDWRDRTLPGGLLRSGHAGTILRVS